MEKNWTLYFLDFDKPIEKGSLIYYAVMGFMSEYDDDLLDSGSDTNSLWAFGLDYKRIVISTNEDRSEIDKIANELTKIGIPVTVH